MMIVLIRDIRVYDKKSCKRCIVGLCLDRSSTLLTSTKRKQKCQSLPQMASLALFPYFGLLEVSFCSKIYSHKGS